MINLSTLLREISRLKQENAKLALDNQELKQRVADNEEVIINAMLSVTEVYETLLASTPLTLDELEEVHFQVSDNIIVIYIALILKGRKTLDEIPPLIRSQVEVKMQGSEE